MNYPDMKNPRHVRSRIYNTYTQYMNGTDIVPRLRIRREVEELPRKTQPIAALLAIEWATIDGDREYFNAALQKTYDILAAREDPESKHGLIVTRIGRNAVYLAEVDAANNRMNFGQYTLGQFTQMIPDEGLAGGAITRRGDYLHGDFKGLIEREGNVSGVMGVSTDEAISLLTSITKQPVTVASNDPRL